MEKDKINMDLTKRQQYYKKYFVGRKRIKYAEPQLKKDKLWCSICKTDFTTLTDIKEHKYNEHSY